MSITIPNKVQRFKALEKDFGTTIAVSLWRRAIQLQNYINASIPVGKLIFIAEAMDGVVVPDSNYWKLCDGTAVSNSNSPINGVTLPDLRGRFFKHPETGGIVGSGGSNTKDLNHNHTGFTIPARDSGFDNVTDDAPERPIYDFHRHTISTSTNLPIPDTVLPAGPQAPPAAPAGTFGAVDIRPPYHSFRVYMRIV